MQDLPWMPPISPDEHLSAPDSSRITLADMRFITELSSSLNRNSGCFLHEYWRRYFSALIDLQHPRMILKIVNIHESERRVSSISAVQP
jgi:hypothetical protein